MLYSNYPDLGTLRNSAIALFVYPGDSLHATPFTRLACRQLTSNRINAFQTTGYEYR